MKRFILLAVSLLVGGSALAQDYPNKPIKFLVPFTAGSGTDLIARSIADTMSKSMGQPIVIENKPGAGGVVAGDMVAKAEPDGHTLLLMSNGTAVSATLFQSLPFNAQKDFAPVATLGVFDIAVLTAADSRFKSMKELLAYARANPGKLNMATINVGSSQHLSAEQHKTTAAVHIQVVRYHLLPGQG